MSTPNKSFAAAVSDRHSWTVRTTSEFATSMSDGESAFIDRIEDLYTVFGDLFRPTSVDFVVDCAEDDGPVRRLVSGDSEGLDTREGTIENEDGVSCAAILEELDRLRPAGGYVFPVRMEFDGESQLYVDGSFQEVSRNSTDLFKGWDAFDEEYIGSLPYDPIQCRVHLRPLGDGFDICPIFRFGTDIWFEETKYGRLNRFQIVAMLARLVGSLEIEQIKYKGPWGDLLGLCLDDERFLKG